MQNNNDFIIENGVLKEVLTKENYIHIPENVTVIADYAFFENKDIEYVSIPQSVEIIGDSAFCKCINLKLVDFSTKSKVERIGKYAFANCFSIAEFHLPKSVKRIGHNAFIGDEFEFVDYNGTLRQWMNIEFEFNPNLAYLSFSSPATVSKKMYIEDLDLKNIIIPKSVKKIKNYAFEGFTDIETVVLESGITEIGINSFARCNNLKEIYIPKTVKKVRENAFMMSKNLKKVNYEHNLLEYCNIKFYTKGSNPAVYAEEIYIDDLYYQDLVIPDNIIVVGQYQFSGFKQLTSIKMKNVHTIERYAFVNCSNVHSVKFTSNLKSIYEAAFLDCVELENVYFEGKIGSYLKIYYESALSNPKFYAENFYLNGQLINQINIPKDIKRIRPNQLIRFNQIESFVIHPTLEQIDICAFILIKNVKEVRFTGTLEEWMKLNEETHINLAYLFNEDTKLYIGGCLIEDLIIPDGVKEIPESCFSNTNIKTVSIPDSVYNIRSSAFSECRNLEKVILSEKSQLNTIWSNAFNKCIKLKEFNFPYQLDYVGYRAFYGASSLENITWGNYIDKILIYTDTFEKTKLNKELYSKPFITIGTVYDQGLCYDEVEFLRRMDELTNVKDKKETS